MSAEVLWQLAGVHLHGSPTQRFPREPLSLAIPAGITAVLGWSGAGKTSLLDVLARFREPIAGSVDGPRRIAWVPQDHGLWPGHTARQHLALVGGDATALLAAFDLNDIADRDIATLSQGEAARLAVARALAQPTQVLIMDEPLAHVDPARVGKYWRVLREQIARTGQSLIFSTHSPEVALSTAQHALCLHAGAVIFHGPIAKLYERPATETLAALLGPTNWLTPADAHQWLGETWEVPASIRPERLSIAAGDGPFSITATRFHGAFAETEVAALDGTARTFLHRPATRPPLHKRCRLALLIVLLFSLLTACQRNTTPVLEVKSWHAWMLPADDAKQPTPRSMATGPHDEVAVMDTAGRILIYSASGTLLRQWKMLDVQFGKPEGIVWLADDRLVVCDTHYRRLVWFDQSGHVLHMVGQEGRGHGEFIFPVGICKDAAENLYVCEYGGNDRIQVFTREGEWLREFGSCGTGPSQFQRPSGLTWHEGRIYVSDAVNNRIHIFQDTGESLGLLGAKPDGTSALSLNLPYDITYAPDGSLYIIEYGAGRLTRVALDGRLLARYGTTGSAEAQFATPWGLTIDSKMRALIADTKNRRIVALQL